MVACHVTGTSSSRVKIVVAVTEISWYVQGQKNHLKYFRTSYLVSLLYLWCVFLSIFSVLSNFKRKFAPCAVVSVFI